MYKLSFKGFGNNPGSGVAYMENDYGDEAAFFLCRILELSGFQTVFLKDSEPFYLASELDKDIMDLVHPHPFNGCIYFSLRQPLTTGRVFFRTSYSLHELVSITQRMAYDRQCDFAELYEGYEGCRFRLRKSYSLMEVMRESVQDKVFIKNGGVWR